MPPYHHYYGSMDDDGGGGGGGGGKRRPMNVTVPPPPPAQANGRPPPRRRRVGSSSSSCFDGEVMRGVLFGAINASICLPASVSFATIIFRHEAFGAWPMPIDATNGSARGH